MKLKRYLWGIMGFLLFLGFDQFTKYIAVSKLKDTDGSSVISGIFRLQYLENHGAAFGILQNQRILLLIVTMIILALLTVIYIKIPYQKRFGFLRFVGVLIAAGAVGNLVDRLIYGYVVDFLYFELINFPIFNVADCYVVCAAILAFFLICFYYKDEDFAFMKRKEK